MFSDFSGFTRPACRAARHVAAGLLAIALVGCARTSPASPPAPRRTCAVLSVGGAKGIAHVGAIRAMRDRGIRPDCVVGNSMGALIGALYAANPETDVGQSYREFAAQYVETTGAEARRRGSGAGILTFLLILASGGAALPAAGAGLAAGTVGAATTNPMDHERAVEVLDALFEARRIEELPVPFAAGWIARRGDSFEYAHAVGGYLAETVGNSLANPILFQDLDANEQRAIDAGLDRVSALPVQLACRLFPDARLIAIDVNGAGAYPGADTNCPIFLVDVRLGAVDAEDVLTGGPAFDRVARAGYDATARALDHRGRERR